MTDINTVRDELYKAAERIVNRELTPVEKTQLIKSYNSKSGDIFEKCRKSLEEILNIELTNKQLLEKTASVDRVMMAIKNLKQLSSNSIKRAK
ncbi:MAG: hypothetical protein COW01_09925 [Bdellovibrionales bacterium CG12_big_fil_rev_8_21_14_0_65_38_15]|nr:MAG: hypothetical protein COW79_06770 [Bdellovibrionales bacterium CG22_combo_CG10-13_8_21_14_all_38_13]PIQ54454.1 MAG: hypothetical protein COW01_09925 [Bdellovibrionales bacterium CG12_big_fil_rev_8_21_14_0_65_38_15]PIR29835.1 MAG: hypothetical protein COV38_07770 [Bdellovibrionales bacterium CG11_big_fil_rev_8_21_14_0_20_38_13]